MAHNLEDVAGIGKATADRLRAAGIDTVEKLASSDPSKLVELKIKGVGESTAIKYINNAKSLLELPAKEIPTDIKEQTSTFEKVLLEKEKPKNIELPKYIWDKLNQEKKMPKYIVNYFNDIQFI